ncbi:MAG: DUF2271 domain-containing protein [Cellvibrionaceae bacterium]|nr:DUF2271 domain-containing protein [Cellvibrionaceae bacterium]
MRFKHCFFLILFTALSTFTSAGDKPVLKLSLELPKIQADPYLKPYVAIWLEDNQRRPITTIALWYQLQGLNTAQADGKKWLKDLRQWWRKIGRSKAYDLDGVTGATRRPGSYEIGWPLSQELFKKLNSGSLVLHVEAAREEGGRSYQRIPLGAFGDAGFAVAADGELGAIQVWLVE